MSADLGRSAVRRATRGLAFVVALCVALPAAPAAQTPADRQHEVGVAVLVGPGTSLGDTAATLDRPDGGTLTLFETANRQGTELGAVVDYSVPVGGPLEVEVSGAWIRTTLRSRLSGDHEEAPSITATEGVSRFTVEGALRWTVRSAERHAWFVRGGGGWLREISASRALGANAGVAHVGAGVKYWWSTPRPGGRLRYGVRVEGRLAARWRALALDRQRFHLAPVLTTGLIIGL